jgi:hypothetical protein
MKSTMFAGIFLGLVFLVALPATADQSLLQTVATGCQTELEGYC